MKGGSSGNDESLNDPAEETSLPLYDAQKILLLKHFIIKFIELGIQNSIMVWNGIQFLKI